MKGNKIETLIELNDAAKQKKSVVCNINSGKPIPASVIMNFQGNLIFRTLSEGMFIYEKKSTKTKKQEAKIWQKKPQK